MTDHVTPVPFETERELAPLPLLWARVVEAYALAQHFLPGEGPDSTRTRHALMGNTGALDVRATPQGPTVARFTMDCRWLDGDPSVLVAAIA